MKTNEIPAIRTESLLADELSEKRIGYKVVCSKNTKSFSPATSSALQRITYRLHRETRQIRGEFGPLAVFDTLEHAERFFVDYGDHILRVEYEPSDEDELWKKNPPSFVKSWRGYSAQSNGTSEKSLDTCPAGTILASSVYVLEIIK